MRLKSLNKKGQGAIGLVSAGVLTLVFGAILFVMGMMMLDGLYIDQSDTAGSTQNETFTGPFTNIATNYQVANAGKCAFDNFEITKIYNQTANATSGAIALGNVSTQARAGTFRVTYANNLHNVSTGWNVTYTYTYATGSACDAANTTLIGMGKFADYFDLIILAVIIAVVIALILGAVAVRRVQ